MSGFANQVIGGISKLVRAAIQSPNFVSGTSGWTINKDGSAEFNLVTIRGTIVITNAGQALLIYNGTPAAGNLMLAIGTAGSDAFGNNWNKGITLPRYSNLGFSLSEISFPTSLASEVAAAFISGLTLSGTEQYLNLTGPQPSGVAANQAAVLKLGYQNINASFAQLVANDINFRVSGTAGGGNFTIEGAGGGGPTGFQWGLVGALNLFQGNAYQYDFEGGTGSPSIFELGQVRPLDLKVNAGPQGKYCSGNWTFSTSRATGVLTNLSALTQARLNSDYGTPIAAGVFNPPVDGYYDLSLFMNSASGATREAVIITKNGVEIAHNEAPNPTNIVTSLEAEYLLATDTVSFAPFYTSATTPQTVTGRVNIARRL